MCNAFFLNILRFLLPAFQRIEIVSLCAIMLFIYQHTEIYFDVIFNTQKNFPRMQLDSLFLSIWRIIYEDSSVLSAFLLTFEEVVSLIFVDTFVSFSHFVDDLINEDQDIEWLHVLIDE